MCGFLGVVDRAGDEIDLAGLEPRITRQLLQRGPDVCKSDRGPGWYLAHSRLSITDESAAADQPFTNTDRTVFLLLNGEIYNHTELGARLGGEPLRTKSDTEVVFRLYQKCGVAAFDHLDGTFALVILDLARRTLIAARDAVGKRPLFVSARGSRVACASDASLVGALFNAPLNGEALRRYLDSGCASPLESVFAGVHPVRPGEILTFSLDADRPDVHRSRIRPRLDDVTDTDDVVGLVEQVVGRAVAKRVANVRTPVLFFSGGLDSTLVARFLKDHFATVDALTLKPILPWELDYPYAKEGARRYGLSLRAISYPIRTLSDDLDELVSRQDEPMGVLSFLPLAFMSTEARGMSKVVFTGDGGDEVFYGYDSVALWTDTNGSPVESDLTSGPPLPAWVGPGGRRQAAEGLVGHAFARLDRAVSELGVEVRCPLCDYGLMVAMRRQPRDKVLPRPKHIMKEILARDFPTRFVNRPKVGFATRIKYYQALDGFAFIRRHLTPRLRSFLLEQGVPVPAGPFPPAISTVFREFPRFWNLAVLSAFLARERYV